MGRQVCVGGGRGAYLRLSEGLLDQDIRDLVARLQGFELINLHPGHVPLETVELQQQAHLAENKVMNTENAPRTASFTITLTASHKVVLSGTLLLSLMSCKVSLV